MFSVNNDSGVRLNEHTLKPLYSAATAMAYQFHWAHMICILQLWDISLMQLGIKQEVG